MKFIIFGAGSHAKSCINLVTTLNYNVAYLVDPYFIGSEFLGFKVVKNILEINNFSDYSCIVAVGHNFQREKIYNNLMKIDNNLSFPALVHPNVSNSVSVNVGIGSIIMANAYIGPYTTIGKFCILNTSSVLEHDGNLFDFSSLAPNSTLGGNVSLGYRSAVSISASVKHGIRIGNDTVIGASSYVDKNLGNNIIAYGLPAKEINQRKYDDPYL